MKYFLILFSLLLTADIFAQDTTIVQTFTWDNDARSGYFSFPDDPNASFRKIWMRYNMRCHDAAVGNGNVGCREWDYSCNTFITDTTRRDSTRLLHPSHVISNFSGTQFNFANQQTYSYTSYQQHQSTLVGFPIIDAQIGTGSDAVLLSNQQATGRHQFLYTNAELQASGLQAGVIYGIRLDVKEWNGQLGFFSIRLKQSNISNLNPENPELEGFETVYFSNTSFSGNSGFQDFIFFSPYNWDGNSSLIVDLSFTHNTASSAITLNGETSADNNALSAFGEDYYLEFKGAGNVLLESDNLTDINNEVTIMLWTYGDQEALPRNTTLFNGQDALGRRQFNVHLPWSNSNLYWDCGDDGSGYDRINRGVDSDADFEGRWNHWAFTKNTTSGEMKMYLNGQLWHTGTGNDNIIQAITKFVLASDVNGNNPYYGSIDEWSVWNVEMDQTTINEWMRKPISSTHPYFNNLLCYHPMNEGGDFKLSDPFNTSNTALVSLPNWKKTRGKDLYKHFKQSSIRPNIVFKQGNFFIDDKVVTVLDSTINPANRVISYGVSGSDLVILDTSYYFSAGYQYVTNEENEIIDSIFISPEGSIDISQLTYYSKSAAKYEILSLVTPYGNGLNLGSAGKTFVFDVTDYAPILKGEKFLSVEMGGQNQEELDVQFIFISGTPEREVINIQNIWPFRRGWIDQILNDDFFEPRAVPLHPNGTHFKIRTAITGHGQNGEFVPRQHYININEGAKDFEFDVWKYCGKNPIYPQGGTWIFDRSGWCPGMATDVHHFPLDGIVNPGDIALIDYGVNGTSMSEANYLVSSQLVTYGPFAFQLDASIETVIRPNKERVEFERINPVCNTPTILVRNGGSQPINSLEIQYGVEGGYDKNWTWSGSILPAESQEIELPLNELDFWMTNNSVNTFTATILSVNGTADEYPDNNSLKVPFEQAKSFDFDDPLELILKTNLKSFENSYLIKDAEGNIVFSRDNLDNETTYADELDLPAGCYTFQFEDAGNDGLSFWFFPNNGNGQLRFTRKINANLSVPMQVFNPDFGGGVQFDFVRPEMVGIKTPEQIKFMSVYPNPAPGWVNLELLGYEQESFDVQVVNLSGQTVYSEPLSVPYSEKFIHRIDLPDLPAGMYFLKLISPDKIRIKELIIGK